ncbi:EAL domain-containing response regulator [Azohydromonas caseinilytica]|uniref:EAL domain-containing protein n=1 Tax=Azohydromonas caseinilytica TaxID=2728836 RepID=A0A848FBR8_9BURK|nr:EAL domain-containing protein [Azohydromonas caseinilytica]NML16175.1 EAL domain-containing protein [Azohydromonas caseinilytica]
MSDFVSPPAAGQQLGRAWVLLADAYQADQVESELRAEGWQVDVRVSRMQHLLLELHCEPTPPDVLVCGLAFDDGDAFRLMRLLAGDSRAPALYFTGRHQLAVLKSAVTMADACKLRVAGCAEQPVAAGHIARTLREYRRDTKVEPQPVPPELTESTLRAMLEQGRLQAWLQAQLRLDSREVVGVETLMRGVAEDGSVLKPEHLVPALRRHGLLDAATLAMVRQTSAFLVGCLEEGLPLSGSVNASLHSLSDPGFCSELTQIVQASGLDPSWLTLEISEHDTVADLPTLIENTARIRLLGFNLSIDDFGSAASSLQQLAQLPFSELKIDRSFVTRVDADPTKQLIVSACAQLARGLGLRIVAEGVETLAEMRTVEAAGCTEVQGYLQGEPMTMDAMRQWLRSLNELRVPLDDMPFKG